MKVNVQDERTGLVKISENNLGTFSNFTFQQRQRYTQFYPATKVGTLAVAVVTGYGEINLKANAHCGINLDTNLAPA